MAYCTVVLRYLAEGEGTEFHPKTLSGPDSALAWGQFSSEAEAHAWAGRNLRGYPYEVAWVGDGPTPFTPRTIPVPGWERTAKAFS